MLPSEACGHVAEDHEIRHILHLALINRVGDERHWMASDCIRSGARPVFFDDQNVPNHPTISVAPAATAVGKSHRMREPSACPKWMTVTPAVSRSTYPACGENRTSPHCVEGQKEGAYVELRGVAVKFVIVERDVGD